MNGHYDDASLLAFIKKKADAKITKDIELHMEQCTSCYQNYLELVKHEHERTETPETSFVEGILKEIRIPERISLKVILENSRICFYDALSKLIDPITAPISLHGLSSGSASNAVALTVGGIPLVLQVGALPAGNFQIAVSTPENSGELSVSCERDGTELEAILLSQENVFQTRFAQADYLLSVRRSDQTLGQIGLSLA